MVFALQWIILLFFFSSFFEKKIKPFSTAQASEDIIIYLAGKYREMYVMFKKVQEDLFYSLVMLSAFCHEWIV